MGYSSERVLKTLSSERFGVIMMRTWSSRGSHVKFENAADIKEGRTERKGPESEARSILNSYNVTPNFFLG